MPGKGRIAELHLYLITSPPQFEFIHFLLDSPVIAYSFWEISLTSLASCASYTPVKHLFVAQVPLSNCRWGVSSDLLNTSNSQVPGVEF
jgi:hypothetical protein